MGTPETELVRAVLILALGAPMGSFAALLADRLPRGRPVALTRSCCDSCQTPLRWFELIPILSWPALRGRCRSCAAPIPARLWQAELAGLALAGLALWSGLGLWGAALFWCLLALILSDLRFYRLPDLLTGSLFALACAAAFWPEGPGGPTDPARVLQALAGGAVGAGMFWALARAYRLWRGHDGMGAGDIRLMAGLGAMIVPLAGWQGLALVTLIAGLSGLALGLMRALRRGRNLRRRVRLPFGACLGNAAIFVAAGAALGLI